MQSPTVPAAVTTSPAQPNLTPRLQGVVLMKRDALLVAKLVVPAGQTLPDHPATDDTLAIGVRGRGTFYVEQEVRHISPGEVLDLHAGETYSIDADDELEVILVQGH